MTTVHASLSDAARSSASDIRGLVTAQSVALVGASEDPASFGNVAARNLVAHSEAGRTVFMVTPRYRTVLGQPAYPTIDDLPADARIDVVLVLVPAALVLGVLEQASRRGARYAIVFSGGFREVGEEGRRLESDLLSFARAAGMRIYGPNTPGLMRFDPRLGMTIQPGFCDDRSAGTIGLIAQSGGLGRCVLQSADRGLAFSYFFSPGNQLDLSVGDFVQFLAEDPGTNVIAALLEGITDPDAFARGADAAKAARKPLVVLKLGRTQAGQRAALSHTGSLAGSDRAFDAFCRAREIIRVNDLDELIAVSALLRHKPSFRRGHVGVYGMSGGAGVLAVDALTSEGLEVAHIEEGTRKAIAQFSGSYVSVTNPVDISGPALSRPETFGAGLDALARDASVGPVLVLLNAWYAGHTERFAGAIASVDAAVENLIIPVWMSESERTPLASLDAAGLPPVRSVRLAARTLAALLEQAGRREHQEPNEATRGEMHVDREAKAALDRIPGERILEPDAKRVLAAAGIHVTRERLVRSASDARRAAEEIGYPVVLKAISPAVVHREREGFVSLDLRTAEDLDRAYVEMHERFTATHGPEDWEGALVSELVVDGVDVFVGVTRDPAWGPLLALGPGGAYADESDRVVLVALPATAGSLRTALETTGIARSVARHSRNAEFAMRSLVDAATRVASIALGSAEIVAIDVNPFRVCDGGVVALDAFMERGVGATAALTKRGR